MILLVLAASVLCALLCLPAWWFSSRRGYFHGWEIVLPAVPILVWTLLTYCGVGAQSLGNIAEVPLLIGIYTALVYLKSFAFQRWSVPKRTGALILAALAVLVPLVMRSTFPMLPE
jgi:hypothetical protein